MYFEDSLEPGFEVGCLTRIRKTPSRRPLVGWLVNLPGVEEQFPLPDLPDYGKEWVFVKALPAAAAVGSPAVPAESPLLLAAVPAALPAAVPTAVPGVPAAVPAKPAAIPAAAIAAIPDVPAAAASAAGRQPKWAFTLQARAAPAPRQYPALNLQRTFDKEQHPDAPSEAGPVHHDDYQAYCDRNGVVRNSEGAFEAYRSYNISQNQAILTSIGLGEYPPGTVAPSKRRKGAATKAVSKKPRIVPSLTKVR